MVRIPSIGRTALIAACFTSSFFFSSVKAQVPFNMTFAVGVLNVLNDIGLRCVGLCFRAFVHRKLISVKNSDLAHAAGEIVNSTEGQNLVMSLSQGYKTVLAPSNAALEKVAPVLAANPGILLPVLEYHVLNGKFDGSIVPAGRCQAVPTVTRRELTMGTAPNHTLARSSLNNSAYVNLEGEKPQAVVLSTNGSSVQILDQGTLVNVTQTISMGNVGVLARTASVIY